MALATVALQSHEAEYSRPGSQLNQRLGDFVVDQLVINPNAEAADLQASGEIDFDAAVATMRIDRFGKTEADGAVDVQPADFAPHGDPRNLHGLAKPPPRISQLKLLRRAKVDDAVQKCAFSERRAFCEHTGL